MSRGIVRIGWLLAAAGVMLWLTTPRRASAPRRRPAPAPTGSSEPHVHEDCAVSECGADGLPLSAYAG